MTQETEDVVALAEALIADGSSDLRPDYLIAALSVCLSRCELALVPQSLSDRIDVLEGFRADVCNAYESDRDELLVVEEIGKLIRAARASLRTTHREETNG